MKNNNSGTSYGIGTLLTVAFVVLKLCGVISWSWVWVLAPTWIPLVIAILILVGCAISNHR